VETGIVGLITLVCLYLITVSTAIWSCSRASSPDVRHLALTLAAASSVPLIASATFDLLVFSSVTIIYLILVGLTAVVYRHLGDAQGPFLPSTASSVGRSV
jgi:hypothetical protein